jgi:hypothetical protein
LPAAIAKVTAWNHWPFPDLDVDAHPGGYDLGPMLATVEYEVTPDGAKEFIKVVRRHGRIWGSDGASRWGIFHDLDHPRFTETSL